MNVKLKYYLLWILTCIIIWIAIAVTWIILYENWYFDDNWSWRIVINRDDKEIYQPTIDDNLLEQELQEIENENKNIEYQERIHEDDYIWPVEEIKEESEQEKTTIVEKIKEPEITDTDIISNTLDMIDSWNISKIEENTKIEQESQKEEIKKENKQQEKTTQTPKKDVKEIELTQQNLDDLYFVTLYDELAKFVDEPSKKALEFLTSYYLLKKLDFDANLFKTYYSYVDLPDKRSIDYDYIQKLTDETKNSMSSNDLIVYINNKKKEIFENMKITHQWVDWNLNISTCFYKFCSEKQEEYNYIKKAIIADTNYLNILWNVKNRDWLDPKIFLTIITIENLRMHSQYKWRFKAVFLKYRTPLLANMSQMSYWMYWTKANFVHRLVNTNFWNTIFTVENDETLKFLKDNFFYYNQKSKQYEYSNTNKFIDYLIAHKDLQSDIVAIFMKMARQWRLTKDIDFYKRENLWYMLTLYNIWKLWEPKTNPELWWATLDFLSTKYNFWELANIVFNSLEMLDIEQWIKNIIN